MRRLLPALLAPLLLLGAARAKVADDLRTGAQAIARRDPAAATAACRRAFGSPEATSGERRQAAEGLLQAAVETGRTAQLADYFAKQRAGAKPELLAILDEALVRCEKARDGHLHKILAALDQQAKKPGAPDARDARRRAATLRALCYRIGRDGEQQASSFRAYVQKLTRPRHGKPPRLPRAPRRHVLPPVPAKPVYTHKPTRLAPEPRRRHAAAALRHIHLAAPRAPRMRYWTKLSVALPAYARPSTARLAAHCLARAYRRSRELTDRGMVETAKAELASVIALFPRTEQAGSAARYAMNIFRRQFGAGQDARMLVAYLQWTRAAAGPHGRESAEYLAIQSCSTQAPADLVARGARNFIQRHPQSTYLTAVRIQLALALVRAGRHDEAAKSLDPIVGAADSKARTKALFVLAWLHIFKGDLAKARAALTQAAAQTSDERRAQDAKALLHDVAAGAPHRAVLPDALTNDQAENQVATHLITIGDAFRLDGDHERAMDLYQLYLRVADDADDFSEHRDRIYRFRETGRMDE